MNMDKYITKSFYDLGIHYASGALSITVDYAIDEVEEPFVMNHPGQTPAGFMEKFTYSLGTGHPQDMLANSIGWLILSPRICNLFHRMCRPDEIELLPLPLAKIKGGENLRGYCAFGVKKRIECLDYDRSEILWSENEAKPGTMHILSLRRCVLKKSNIPKDLNCFLLAPYPVFPIITQALAKELAELRPSGLSLEGIDIS